MIAQKGALIIASFVLAFVAISLVADMLPSFGVDTGPIAGGIVPTKSNENCKCEFDKEKQDFTCNKNCGYKAGTFCTTDDDCVA
jgi:hypothetical protein